MRRSPGAYLRGSHAATGYIRLWFLSADIAGVQMYVIPRSAHGPKTLHGASRPPGSTRRDPHVERFQGYRGCRLFLTPPAVCRLSVHNILLLIRRCRLTTVLDKPPSAFRSHPVPFVLSRRQSRQARGRVKEHLAPCTCRTCETLSARSSRPKPFDLRTWPRSAKLVKVC